MVLRLYITSKNYSSWSLRPWVLLHMLDIPFEEIMVVLNDGSWRQPHWKAFSPTANVPCLHDVPDPAAAPDATIADITEAPPAGTLVLWNSLSIVEHLADTHPDKPIWPSLQGDPAARAWARAAAAEMHAGFETMRSEMGMNCGMRIELGTPSPELRKNLDRVSLLWSEGLTRFGGPFLAGKEFGAVDALFAPVVIRTQTYVGAVDYMSEPAKKYIERMLELPPMKQWLADAIKETGRERLHEEEAIQGRMVLEDLRTTA
ncbi:glutathione S-transferase [Thozetella sp. PMI_491]|nr:glutathione S-transferase [Thozetella sp. PMI_491]